MIRRTSIDAYNTIKENGLLSERRWQVYDLLFEHGPCTGSEMAILYRKKYGMLAPNAGNMVTRMGELRNQTVAYEVRERPCSITKIDVIEFDVTENLPIKFDKPKSIKCKACNGKGRIETQQGRLL